MIDAWEGIVLIVVGVIAGVVNTVAGGGSLLVIPALVMTGMPALVANATSRPAIILQCLSGTIAFRNLPKSEGSGWRRVALAHGLMAVPGAALGAAVAAFWTGETTFRVLLAVVLLAAAFHTWRRRTPGRNQTKLSPAGEALLFLAIGFYGGFIQAGVGFAIIAALAATTPWTMKRINAEKVVVVGVYTFAALLVFTGAGDVRWIPALLLVAGQTAGGYLGARLVSVLSEAWLMRAFVILLVVFAVSLLL